MDAGNLTLTIGSTGALSGKLLLGGKSYSLKGIFNPSGDYTLNFVAPSGAPGSLLLHYDTADFEGSISATLNLGGGNVAFTLNQNQWNKKTNPAAHAGYYTMILPAEQPAAAGAPEGDGYGTFKIDAGGKVKGIICLPDGGKATLGSFVSAGGEIPVGVLVKAKATALSGTLVFNDVPEVSDLDGTLTWLKSKVAGTKDIYYRNGFTTDLPAVGSKYDAATVASTLFSGTSSAKIENGSSIVSGTTTGTVLLLAGGKTFTVISTPVTSSLKTSFKTSTGLFSGSFIDAAGVARKFNGALLQKQSKGAGFFLGKDAAGTTGFSGYSDVDASKP
jgi:hypothetical protein